MLALGRGPGGAALFDGRAARAADLNASSPRARTER